jgi:class 3 adenylate cyclase/tetratricopeptide (TPR) repeat protein
MVVCPSCGTENPDRARFCLECGVPLADDAQSAEERKLVTVLFADLTDSTMLGDRFDAETLKDLLARFFAAMRDEIEAEGGTVEKFIGDAVVAAFGVPTAHEDDPARALRAALRMQLRLRDLNRELDATHGVELAMRVGVNTGDVLAATAPRSGEAMATGDAVNVAARLQQAAEPGQILVGDRTAAAVRGFVLEPAAPLDLRGKATAVGAMLLAGERDEPGRGVPGLRSPMVGRDGELELLGSLLRRAVEDARGHLVTIYGDPGVGKSRLVAEFAAQADARAVRGRCLPYGDGITFWPLAEIVKAEAGVLDNDPPDVALGRIRALGESAPELAPFLPALIHTIGLDDPDSPLRDLSPRAVMSKIHAGWRGFFTTLAGDRPLIVVVEDIHWADGAMLDLLEELPDRIPAPVVFLCPTRPELTTRRASWGGGRRSASSIALEPLGADDAEQMVRLLLHVDGLPGEAHDRILERAEGNPFFLEEIVRRLIDEQLIVHESGRWRAAGGIEHVPIPDTIQGVLAARIDLLPPDEKRAVQSAAVVGRVFWPGAVAGLLNGEAERVEETLERLERRDLVLSRIGSAMAGERELIFKHILTRDVAYESLPRRDRPAAHARVAEWIEATFGERRGEVVELLAHHFDLAGDRPRARRYALEAARRDLARLALDHAQAFAERAIELAENGRERAAALIVLGETAYQRAAGDAAHRAWREAFEMLNADPDADPDALATVCGRLALIVTRAPGLMPQTVPTPEEARRYIDRGLAAAGDEESVALVELLLAEGGWAYGFPDPPPTDDVVERMRLASARAVAIAERLGRAELISIALDVQHISHELRDDVHAIVAGVDRRRGLADGVVALIDLDDIFYMSAQAAWEQGRYVDAAAYCEEGVARVTALGGDAAGSAASLAIARFLLGDWDAAVDACREVIARYGPVPPGFLRALCSVAEYVHAARGGGAELEVLRAIEYNAAMRRGYRALGLCAEGRANEAFVLVQGPHRPAEGLSFQMMAEARVLHALGRRDELLDRCTAIRERARRIDWAAGPAMADRLEAELLLAGGGEPRHAVELAGRSAEIFAGIGAEWDAAVSRLSLAEALLALGRPSVAAEALARAETALRRAGARAELERFTSLAAQARSGPDDGQHGGGGEHAGEPSVDEAGATGVAE